MCIIVNTHALYSHQNTMIFISLLPPAMRIRLSEKTLEIKWEDIGNYGVAILTSWAITMGPKKIFVDSQLVFLLLNQPFLLSICTGILGIFDILQFEISSLMNWIFFLVWKQTGYFYQFKLDFFPSSWARVKYFDGPCITIYSLFTIYRDIHYQLLVWWIHYTHCCESKKWKPGKFHLCSLWNDIFNYPNWDFGFC